MQGKMKLFSRFTQQESLERDADHFIGKGNTIRIQAECFTLQVN